MLVVVGGLTAFSLLNRGVSSAETHTAQPQWREIAWPFPTDQWGRGKAFVCAAGDCGIGVTLYIRAKIGFCNCTTGVADDAELNRISDFELIDKEFVPLAAGRPITVAWMKGRSRAFAFGGPSRAFALSVGFNDRCDAIVATALVADGQPVKIESAVLDFLNSKTVVHWAEITLGL